MNALILAAGYATRLYPLTLNKAKPLLVVGDKPIIEWVVDNLDGVPDHISTFGGAAVDIPVVGLGEATLLAALSMGRRLGLVTIDPVFIDWHERQVRAHGLDQRVLVPAECQQMIPPFRLRITNHHDRHIRRFCQRNGLGHIFAISKRHFDF